MLVKSLASAALAGVLLSVAVGPAPAAAQAALAADSGFIQMAGSLGLLQVKLGKLAEKKGSSDVVRDFGKRMVDEYTEASAELTTAAKQAAYPAPVLLRQHQQLVDRFSGMGKSDFDRNYMAEMVNQHDQAVRLFQDQAESGRVTSLKQLASRMLPLVQEHASVAAEAARLVGADVTAASSRARPGS